MCWLQVGLIEISPYDQQPKIKIYREGDESSECKGDGSLCYNSEESVKLAIEILDGGFLRPAFQIRVTRADFSNVVLATNKRPTLSQAQVRYTLPIHSYCAYLFKVAIM